MHSGSDYKRFLEDSDSNDVKKFRIYGCYKGYQGVTARSA